MSWVDIFARNIRYYRFQKGYSQEKLGTLSDRSARYISDLELGISNPTLDTITNLAMALEISIDQLFIDHSENKITEKSIAVYRKTLKQGVM